MIGTRGVQRDQHDMRQRLRLRFGLGWRTPQTHNESINTRFTCLRNVLNEGGIWMR